MCVLLALRRCRLPRSRDWRQRSANAPTRQSRIESWDPPRKFVDVQTRGPYSLWHHTHEFAGYRDGTVVRDTVRYKVPLGALGALVGGKFVQRDLERIFAFRHQQLKKIFARDRQPTPTAAG